MSSYRGVVYAADDVEGGYSFFIGARVMFVYRWGHKKIIFVINVRWIGVIKKLCEK